MKRRVSDYIADYLEKIDVKKVFLLSGGGIMHLIDAISRKEKLKYICNHHEQSCVMAAEGYARQSGKIGVSYVTSGPGATNTITGIVGAWLDSTPLLVISGQSKLSQTIRHTKISELRQFGTFEVDSIPIVKSITKYAAVLDDPQMVSYHLEKAITLATTGRPGPVFLEIPIDIQGMLINEDQLVPYIPQEEKINKSSLEEIDFVLEKIKKAKRPLILAGHGIRVSGSVDLFLKLILKLNVPVVTTQLATDLLDYNHPLYVGHPGMKGDRPGNFAIQTTDCLVILGSSLHVLTTGYELDQFAPQAYKIQIEEDIGVLKKEQVGVNKKIISDIKFFLEQLDDRISKESFSPKEKWQEKCNLWKKELAVINEPHKDEDEKVNYYHFCEVLSNLCDEKCSIVTDAGTAFYVIGQAFKVKTEQRVIISGGLGTMGFALPASTGVALAKETGQTICVTGDGSLQTNIHEFATIAHNNLNIKIFILNNSGYISIQNTQNSFFKGHYVGVDAKSGVSFPNLEKIASAYGIDYVSVISKDNLKQTMQKVLDSNGPIICEIMANNLQEVIPTVSSVRLENGQMKSKPLHDMFPFMDKDVLEKYTQILD
ncbi:MAG: thiamine pyrophosphate-binding protein [Bacteriovoracaceae bacterium]|nr:thiamine pyrophosphate-binding protein [Bacteriovoracaceae bacterium]